MKPMTLHALPDHTAPTCPPWCVRHSDDFDRLADPGEQYTRLHLGPETTMRYAVPGGPGQFTVTVTVRLERYDTESNAGPVAVGVFGTEDAHRDDPEFASIGINDTTPMVIEDAARFAELLLAAVGTHGRTDAPQSHANKIDPWGWGDRVECRDCVQSFYPDSSPHLDRCYECAARVDGEVLV